MVAVKVLRWLVAHIGWGLSTRNIYMSLLHLNAMRLVLIEASLSEFLNDTLTLFQVIIKLLLNCALSTFLLRLVDMNAVVLLLLGSVNLLWNELLEVDWRSEWVTVLWNKIAVH